MSGPTPLQRRLPRPLGTGSGLKIAAYSHDTVGLGHFRRNLQIAEALSQISPRPHTLMIAGATEASRFARPQGVDHLTLPALRKEGLGRYASRSLGLPASEILEMRSRTIQAAISCFDPDVFIVDNVPRGAARELDTTLEALKSHGRTICVLGLRDVLDDPAAVRREWSALENEEAIQRYYDAVWVYGDRRVCDQTTEYAFAESTSSKLSYIGYFDRAARPSDAHQPDSWSARAEASPAGAYTLCMLGGGEDGAALAHAFAGVRFSPERRGLMLTGPFMPPEVRAALRRKATREPCLEVLEFASDSLALVRRADRVVAMGGYNSVSEALSFDRPTLIVPRVTPRREQWIRAKRLSDLGLVSLCEPRDLSPETIERWLSSDVKREVRTRDVLDMHGLECLPRALGQLLHDARERSVRPSRLL